MQVFSLKLLQRSQSRTVQSAVQTGTISILMAEAGGTKSEVTLQMERGQNACIRWKFLDIHPRASTGKDICISMFT